MKQITKTLTPLLFFTGSFFVSLFCSFKTTAQGNLLVTPKRVVFEGNKRSEELNLANVGKDTATYLISLIQIRMKEDGSFERITEPDSAQNFADKNVRFFPRSVKLGPNEAQTVKVQLTKANELAPGEYRSHLYFRASPPEKPLGDSTIEKDSVLSIKLTPVFGISIPVIIRKGELNATVNIPDIKFNYEKDAVPALNITFTRSGNMSVYGDIAVDHISPQGKMTRVGAIKGMALYTPNTRRRLHLVLAHEPGGKGVNYHTGKLQVVYTDEASRSKKLAQGEIELH